MQCVLAFSFSEAAVSRAPLISEKYQANLQHYQQIIFLSEHNYTMYRTTHLVDEIKFNYF
jgi:hypothetical protein